MVQKTRAELEMELKEIEQKLHAEQSEIQKKTEYFKSMEEERKKIEKEISDLDAPSNLFLKAFSRLSNKASNVVRNVRLATMSEEQLNEEYTIYQRISENLGKPTVSFEEFKAAPEDYVYKERKESLLKKIEDEISDGLSKTVEGLTKASTTIQEKTHEISEKTKPELEKIKEKVASTIENNKINPDSTAQKLKESILNSVEESKPLLNEIGRTFKLGASLLKTKIEKVGDSYAAAKAEVEAHQNAAQTTGSTPPKTETAAQAQAIQDEKQAKVVGNSETTINKATPNTKGKKLSRRDQFLIYMDTIVQKHGTDISDKADYKEYALLAGEEAYKEPNFKRFVNEFETALKNGDKASVEAEKPVASTKVSKKKTAKKM